MLPDDSIKTRTDLGQRHGRSLTCSQFYQSQVTYRVIKISIHLLFSSSGDTGGDSRHTVHILIKLKPRRSYGEGRQKQRASSESPIPAVSPETQTPTPEDDVIIRESESGEDVEYPLYQE